MITVKMTDTEYEAYQLYLKSIEIMRKTKKKKEESHHWMNTCQTLKI